MPRASRDEIVGFEVDSSGADTLRVRVSAPPVDGRANDALVRLLAAALGVANGAVEIVGGHTARTKIVAIDGLTFEQIRERLTH